MRIDRFLTTAMCLGLLAAAVVPQAKATLEDKKTVLTFDNPVEVPGVVLPKGRYVFKLMADQADRHIVQIFDANERHLYATVLGIPAERTKVSDTSLITFEQLDPKSPEAVEAWFYPGEQFGTRFVYPMTRAKELAKTSHRHVACMPDKLAGNIKKPAKTMQEPHVQEMKKAAVQAVSPEGVVIDELDIFEMPLATK